MFPLKKTGMREALEELNTIKIGSYDEIVRLPLTELVLHNCDASEALSAAKYLYERLSDYAGMVSNHFEAKKRETNEKNERPEEWAYDDGYKRGLAQEHLKHPDIVNYDGHGIADFATILGYRNRAEDHFIASPERAAFVMGYAAGWNASKGN